MRPDVTAAGLPDKRRWRFVFPASYRPFPFLSLSLSLSSTQLASPGLSNPNSARGRALPARPTAAPVHGEPTSVPA